MAVTEKQLAANRKNAQRSTGPRTAQGKGVARMNGLTHGLVATYDVLLPDESPEEYCAFATAVLQDLRPQGGLQHALAMRIVSQLWRLHRASRIETGVLLWELLGQRVDGDQPGQAPELSAFFRQVSREPDPIDGLTGGDAATVRLGRSFVRDSSGADALTRLSRYEMRLSRGLARDLHQFAHLQHCSAVLTSTSA